MQLAAKMTAEDLWQLFNQNLQVHSPFKYMAHHLSEVGEEEQKQRISVQLQIGQRLRQSMVVEWSD